MHTSIKTLASSAIAGMLLIIPLMTMEIVNRWDYNEDFPYVLFIGLWFNLFVISLIVLPIVRARRTANGDVAIPVHAQGNTLLTNPRSAAIIAGVLFLAFPVIPLGMEYLGWAPLELPLVGMFVIVLPLAAGVIAAGPIVSTLRAGGSLFAHPLNLLIVILIVSTFAIGLAGLIIDQWPCFIGVRYCD